MKYVEDVRCVLGNIVDVDASAGGSVTDLLAVSYRLLRTVHPVITAPPDFGFCPRLQPSLLLVEHTFDDVQVVRTPKHWYAGEKTNPRCVIS